MGGASTRSVCVPRQVNGAMELKRSGGPARCRRKFLRIFPRGFRDPNYLAWKRDYKWEAHKRWTEVLEADTFRLLLDRLAFSEIAARAVAIEAPTNLIFSFEKMALSRCNKIAVRGLWICGRSLRFPARAR